MGKGRERWEREWRLRRGTCEGGDASDEES